MDSTMEGSMLLLWITAAALASVDAEDRWIGNDNLTIGVHDDGSFVNSDIEVGILWDPDGPAGEIPMTGDMLRVGYHWDVWIWSWESDEGGSSGVQGGPHTDDWEALTWMGRVDNDAVSVLVGELELDDATIRMRTVALKRADLVIQDIRVEANTDLTDIQIGRTFDPDPDWWFSDSYATVNDSGLGWASAASQWDDRAIGLAGASGPTLGSGGVCTWCDSPDEMLDSTGESSTADGHPNVIVEVDELDEGMRTNFRFVYAFEIGAEDAADAALDGLSLMDLDDDGLDLSEGDCNDLNPDVYPGATELVDGRDNDCDGEIDEDTLASDDDGDGFSEADGDCDDADAEVYPGAEPVSGVSNADCDGVEDTPPDTEEPEPTDTGSPPDTGELDDTGEPEDPSDDDDTADPADDAPDAETEDAPGVITSGEVHKGCSHTSGSLSPVFWSFSLLLCFTRRRSS